MKTTTEILCDEVAAVTDEDKARCAQAVEIAKEYVDKAKGAYEVSDLVYADCVVTCAANLYNAKDARLGVMNVADGDLIDAVHVSADPMRGVWVKLNIAGVPTGGMAIA